MLSGSRPAGSLELARSGFHASTCNRINGDLGVFKRASDGKCETQHDSDPLGQTIFDNDSGSIAFKVELWDSKGMVWKVEFQPFGEHVDIVDTRNDADSVYVQLTAQNIQLPDGHLTLKAPDPGENDVNLDFPEGTLLSFRLTDDSAGNDLIFSLTGGA